MCDAEAANSVFERGEGSNYNILSTEPAVKPEKKIRRGREMAGLPQGGETPLGFSFLKPKFKSLLSPLSLSGGTRFLQFFVCWDV